MYFWLQGCMQSKKYVFYSFFLKKCVTVLFCWNNFFLLIFIKFAIVSAWNHTWKYIVFLLYHVHEEIPIRKTELVLWILLFYFLVRFIFNTFEGNPCLIRTWTFWAFRNLKFNWIWRVFCTLSLPVEYCLVIQCCLASSVSLFPYYLFLFLPWNVSIFVQF